jgi:hypothetical protein
MKSHGLRFAVGGSRLAGRFFVEGVLQIIDYASAPGRTCTMCGCWMELSTAISTASFMASCSVLRPLITWEGVCVCGKWGQRPWCCRRRATERDWVARSVVGTGATSDNQSGPGLPQHRRTLTAAVTFFQVPRHTMP